MRFGT